MRIKAKHKHSHDIYELARVIFPNDEIRLVEEDADICSQLLSEGVRTTYFEANRQRLDERNLCDSYIHQNHNSSSQHPL